jgi:hypothetical protein
MIGDHVCRRDKKDSVEDYDWGKGYTVVANELKNFLDRLRDSGKNVIFTSHVQLKKYNNPEGPDYDRYTIKCHQKFGDMIKEWCEDVVFAFYDTDVIVGDNGKAKAVGREKRTLYSRRTASHDGKTRSSFPETMPFEFGVVFDAYRKSLGADTELREKIAALTSKIDDEKKIKWVQKNAGPAATKEQLETVLQKLESEVTK